MINYNLIPNVGEKDIHNSGFKRQLYFIAKIVSGNNYRYYCIDTTTANNQIDFGRRADQLIDEAFGQLKENESIAGIRINNKDYIYRRYYNPDF